MNSLELKAIIKIMAINELGDRLLYLIVLAYLPWGSTFLFQQRESKDYSMDQLQMIPDNSVILTWYGHNHHIDK